MENTNIENANIENNYINFFNKYLENTILEKLKNITNNKNLTFEDNILNEFGREVNIGNEIKEYISAMGDDLLNDFNTIENKLDEWFFEYKLNESYYKSNEEELLNKAEELREIKKELDAVENKIIDKIENANSIDENTKSNLKDTIKSIFDNFKNKINIFFDNLKNISKDKALENNSIIDNEMKVELLKIDNISHKILDKLSKDNDISSLRKITDHNNTASKTLEYIFNKTNDFKIMENLLNNNNTPTSVINSLAKNEDRDIKLMALSHSNISEDILLKNSKTEDIEVINSLLKNENASLKVLENIVCYNIANEEVLKNITNHPSCNEDLNDFINRKLEIQSANKKSSIKEKIKEKQKIINKNKQEKANTHNNKQANVRS